MFTLLVWLLLTALAGVGMVAAGLLVGVYSDSDKRFSFFGLWLSGLMVFLGLTSHTLELANKLDQQGLVHLMLGSN